MNNSAGRYISASLVLLVTSIAQAEELKNSSFEDPVESGLGYNWVSDRAANWDRWGGWFNRETSWTPVFDGQCMVAYHHWRIQGNETSGLYQDIPGLPAGKPYSFGIKVFKDRGANCDSVEVRLEPFRGGDPIASTVYRMADLKSDHWNQLTVVGTNATAGIRVLVIASPGKTNQRRGAMKFDSASFMAGIAETPVVNNAGIRMSSSYRISRRR
ncbi:MAG TPA: hypothetical protein PLE77_08130 [Kiritimatiellia bacterium]|nr:hypothetical protein [Kiritimatiellia bacterium]